MVTIKIINRKGTTVGSDKNLDKNLDASQGEDESQEDSMDASQGEDESQGEIGKNQADDNVNSQGQDSGHEYDTSTDLLPTCPREGTQMLNHVSTQVQDLGEGNQMSQVFSQEETLNKVEVHEDVTVLSQDGDLHKSRRHEDSISHYTQQILVHNEDGGYWMDKSKWPSLVILEDQVPDT